VLDEAGWLGASAFKSLNERLVANERETSSQLVVAIFNALPQDAEMVDFSQRVFEAWKPGQVGKDNGAILFVFAGDRKLRIHTGYGLEGALPDARCKQILDDVITPLLRNGQREEAILGGVEAMISATKGEYTGTGQTNLVERNEPPFPPTLIYLIIIVLVVLSLSKQLANPDVIISHGGSRRSSSWGGGGGFSGGGGGGFSGGGGRSGGGGASGGW
jgi:uncharacterized protein